MAHTINGIGTSVCPARGYAMAEGRESPDYDAVVCFVVFFLPLIPLRAVHTHTWRGNGYIEVPIRWSAAMVFWAFARRWALALVIAGVFVGITAGASIGDKGGAALGLGLFAAVLFLGGAGVLGAFVHCDQRHRDIRRLIGGHRLGTSDPSTWSEDVLKLVPVSMELFGTPTDSSAVPVLLEKKEYAMAMYAARLTAAREDPGAGEAMTDKILRDPGARAALEASPRLSRWSSF